jgi:hypothetical protein
MMTLDLTRVATAVEYYRLNKIKGRQIVYEWVKTKVINFETFQEMLVRFSLEDRS